MLTVASWFYAAGLLIRRLCYRLGLIKPCNAGKAVISIGNITAGGTGKTPLVVWTCEYLGRKNLRPAVLTRGYKSGGGKIPDEPEMIRRLCPGAAVVIDSNRARGAAGAVSELHANVLVMDDGFQHQRLARDLDIVAIDATCPFGYNRLLPAGLLREPVSSLKRARAAVITRTDQADQDTVRSIEKRLLAINPGLTIARANHEPTHLASSRRKKIPLEQLKNRKVHAFCAIGNPPAFFETLTKLQAELTTQTFNDHHRYSKSEISDIFARARQAGARLIVCTQKDYDRAAPLAPKNTDIQLVYLAIDLKFTKNQEQIERLVDKATEPAGPAGNGPDRGLR